MLIPSPSIKPQSVDCPGCGTPMGLVRVAPRFAGMAELHTFECKRCSAVVTQVADECHRSTANPEMIAFSAQFR
jgi:hypothetical protein